jgi:hypothetical protein
LATAKARFEFLASFRSEKRHGEAAAKFALVATIGLGLNTSMMAMLVGWAHF